MNHEILKRIIFDQHEIIRGAEIVQRDYEFEANANYVLVGLRRAGKSTLLYGMVRELVANGADWEQIVYVNFEDERLVEFTTADFNDLLSLQAEMSGKKGHFFFDEIQNIPGWEKFARRLADAGEHVCITGSNAKMLSKEIATTLGGRYMTRYIAPYSFSEYLRAAGSGGGTVKTTREEGVLRGQFADYFYNGGLPETLQYRQKREYLSGVYQKILLGDIAARNKLRNENTLKILVKKLAETVRSEVSYTKLYSALKGVGVTVSKESVIDYVGYAEDAHLIFRVQNYFYKFSERESTPKYYFTDNGLLNLFLTDKDTALLENAVAVYLKRQYEEVWYLKSAQTGVDVDFYVADTGTAVQVAYSIAGEARAREVANLVKLSKNRKDLMRCLIVTYEEEEILEEDGLTIEVVPAYKYLMGTR